MPLRPRAIVAHGLVASRVSFVSHLACSRGTCVRLCLVGKSDREMPVLACGVRLEVFMWYVVDKVPECLFWIIVVTLVLWIMLAVYSSLHATPAFWRRSPPRWPLLVFIIGLHHSHYSGQGS